MRWGYKTDYPLLWKERTIYETKEIGIERPNTYGVFKHGNCIGCIKAGWQHWYIVFCTRRDVWEKAKKAEEEIGMSIHKNADGPVYLEDRESDFCAMKKSGRASNRTHTIRQVLERGKKSHQNRG